MFILGIILIIAGYFILFNTSYDESAEIIMRQAIAGILLSILGAGFIMFWIYKRSK